LVNYLYDMILIVDQSNEDLYYTETICNFFYHLKYRHIGESIKEKIRLIMPMFKPKLKILFKYITSELSQQHQGQTPQQPQSIPQQNTKNQNKA
jgi:hypothetical protein